VRLKPAKTTLTAKKTFLATILVAGLAILAITSFAGSPQASFATGNGAPSGHHFNLNLIGVSNTKNYPTADGSGGNVIHVPLKGHCNIDLTQGTNFYVLDDNCLDGTANFQLPPTDTVGGNPAYTVWARVVGTPGGSSSITTCATDPTTLETVCSIGETVSFGGHNGKSTFTDVTKQLTTLCFIDQTTGNTVCVNVFDPKFENFFWSYDNNGNKVLQLRFYPI